MLRKFLQHVLLIRKALPGRGDSPRQLAMGLALGLLLGLVPKGNLTAVAISMLIFASTVNVGTAMLTAAAISLACPLIDPVSHRIGLALLTHESLQPYLTQLYQMPVLPWTDLHNTVVAGGLTLGTILLCPAYYVSRPVFQRYWGASDDSGTKESADAHDEVPEADVSQTGIRLPEVPSTGTDTDPPMLEVARPRRRAA